MYKAAIFDMDGTILDTIGDLTDSFNHALSGHDHRHDFTVEDVKNFFGSGVEVAIQRALAAEHGASGDEILTIGSRVNGYDKGLSRSEVKSIEVSFESWYPEHCNIRTRPFDGIEELVKKLKDRDIKCAVVSNKFDPAAQELAEAYFSGIFDYVQGVTPEVRRKPAPDVTFKAMKKLGTEADDAVYIGDSEIDIQTAHNAGLRCISVDWGFRSREFLETHGAEVICSRPEELYDTIVSGGRTTE